MAKADSRSQLAAKKKTAPKKPISGQTRSEVAQTRRVATEKQSSSSSKSERAEKVAQAKAESIKSPLSEPQLPATRGKIGVFGGPRDKSFKADDKLGLPTGQHYVYERARSLNAKSFYCAMRWEYRIEHMSPEEAKRWWANKKILVTNASGDAVVVRAVDHGPHESTGLVISVSPAALEALGAEIGDEVQIALADPKLPTGPVK